VAVIGGGWYGYTLYTAKPEAPPAAAAPKGAAGKGAAKGGFGGPIPVVGATANRGDLDVYLTGLGTVTPLRTVVVRSRVEGQLMRVQFREGQAVDEGQLLAEIDPRQYQASLKQAEGQLARDQALLANAKLDVERYRTLLAQDSIAKQQVDAQEALVRQLEGTVRIDQGLLDNARLQLSYTRITAPVAGRVGLRQVDPGNIVRAGDANGLVVITQLQPITVLFTLPQDTLPAVLKRQDESGKLPVEAWDRELKVRLATGILAAIDNQVDTATGTVKLKASFRNEDNALFPNQFVNVRMKLDTLSGATLVPASAIQRGAQSLFVYVVKDDNRVTARPVKLGPQDGAQVAVTEGVAVGETVVVDGIDRLREGAQVALSQRPEFKAPVDGVARKGDGRSRWMSMSAEEKKAAWEKMSPEQKARLLEAKAKREAEAKAEGKSAPKDGAKAPPKPQAGDGVKPEPKPEAKPEAKAEKPAGAKAGTPDAPSEGRSRWSTMSIDEKKAAWPTLSPEQKARILEAKARREAEAREGKQ
jgi:multidrug efflux system membrane fusion protein